MNVNEISARLAEDYGKSDGVPSTEQWVRLLRLPAGQPVTFLNFFKFRIRAAYAEQSESRSGEEAFQAYSAVSVPAMAKVGGQFIYMGTSVGTLISEDEDWDLVVLGTYPDGAAAVRLFEDPEYAQAFRHRVAACERQKVVMCVS